jgi:hypothetical protein
MHESEAAERSAQNKVLLFVPNVLAPVQADPVCCELPDVPVNAPVPLPSAVSNYRKENCEMNSRFLHSVEAGKPA